MPTCPGCEEEFDKGGAITTHMEHCEQVEKEQHERIEQTRATIIGVLEALDETEMTDEVLKLVESLCQPNILAKHQEVMDHLLEKSRRGDSLNEVDELLAKMVIETERDRDAEQSPAAEIAQGLFAQTERTTAERTTSKQKTDSEEATASEESSESKGQQESKQEPSTPTITTEARNEQL